MRSIDGDMRLIDADELFEYLKGRYCTDCNKGFGFEWCRRTCILFDVLIDVDKFAKKGGIGMKTARWIQSSCEEGYTENDNGEQTEITLASAACSECQRYAVQVSNWTGRVEYEFCPHCGARMISEGDKQEQEVRGL